ncbi:hypothetical protein BDV28DRAFT_155762 [Aspergillus coremiiformis]|uniref:Carrier domain-containing protein n=1 Tax=Aspergillus coremiiformis TaxID=138285 RepID=A0A5N6ZDK2_9EURO|nr:hypothetical protein BDV28DRAFT_155762 [Aspergillus coremiiformis]
MQLKTDSSVEYERAVHQNQGLGQLFHQQAQSTPTSVAVIDGARQCSYEELHVYACGLAHQIRESTTPFSLEEPVGVLVNHGINDVLAQMAIVYAGGSCAPMSPNLPDAQIQSRLNALGARCLLVDQANSHRSLPGIHSVILDETKSSGLDLIPADTYPVPTSLDHRSHLIHTSGTTSVPKAVQILSRSVLHVVFHAPFEAARPSDTVAHVNDTSFDVALFDVWGPLLRGARIAVVQKDVLLDLRALARLIDSVGITFMCTTTALLNLAAATYPAAFSGLRVCFIGGEAANRPAIQQIFAQGVGPESLINAYGPTECCAWCLAHRIDPTDLEGPQGSIPIGRPIGHARAWILDESSLQPVPDGHEGELCIAGPGVSRGYVNRPDQNAEAFVLVGEPPERLYRTGDIVRRDAASGEIDYVGRRDHQVKIRGFRIELEAVETALLKTGSLADAVALKIESAVAGAGSMLVAFAVPQASSASPSATAILEGLRVLLPDYMLPRIHLLDRLPLTSHGKVDRRQLQQLYSPAHTASRRSLGHASQASVQSTMMEVWATVLGVPRSCFQPDDSFFLLGGTSLQASLLVDRVQTTFGVFLSLLTLYEHPTLAQLARVIEDRQAGAHQEPDDDIVQDDRETWLADSQLSLPWLEKDPAAAPVDWTTPSEGRVFLTGATGFVGAFLLVDLLKMSTVQQVGCLVRARSAAQGMERIRHTLEKYQLWQEAFRGRLQIFCGSLEDEHLGLGPDGFQQAASWASVIFHLGARVNYTQPYSVHRPANVLGTLHILQLATCCPTRRIALHYVSSISCYGPTGLLTGATTIDEDGALRPHLDALRYDHGYAQSQWVVEQMLAPLRQHGFPVAVYRPGFILGHSGTGACNPDDFIARLLTACTAMGSYPRLPRQRKEFVPVDYVVSSILHIAAQPANLRHCYNLVPPRPELSVGMDETMELLQRVRNTSLRRLPYEAWVEELKTTTPRALKPLQPMLAEKVYHGRTRWELYENMPVYQTTNTQRALHDFPGGLPFPVLDAGLMTRYLDYLEPRGIHGSCAEC